VVFCCRFCLYSANDVEREGKNVQTKPTLRRPDGRDRWGSMMKKSVDQSGRTSQSRVLSFSSSCLLLIHVGNNEWDLIQINKVYEFETGSSSTAASHLVTKSFYCFGNKAVWNM
jgi:hypothetical protein